MPNPHKQPLARWQLTAELLRLVVLSSRLAVPAPLNLLLVGPPGDGKTEMLRRLGNIHNCPHAMVLSDTTYLGLIRFLEAVRDTQKSCLVIPDLATVVGRKSDVARQCIATMAMMAGEGVGVVSVGKIDRDFRGAQASVVAAITDQEYARHREIINQNAFLSRVFVCDFTLELPEVEALMHPRSGARTPLSFGSALRTLSKDKTVVLVPSRFGAIAKEWWKELKLVRPDMWFAFRSAHQMRTLLQASAYLRGRRRVVLQDVKAVRRVLPVLHSQIRTTNGG